MPTPPLEIPPPLLQLAAIVAAGAAGRPWDGAAPDLALIRQAIVRHRVGPLLARALDRTALAPEAGTLLQERVRANAVRFLAGEAIRQKIAAALAAQGIAVLQFKGTPLAQALYGDPLLRGSGDIDLLVAPRDLMAAAAALASLGLGRSDTLAALPRPLAALGQRVARDITLAGGGQVVEVHSRVFFSPRLERAFRGLDTTFAPQSGQPLASPAIGAQLALYLILHGAVSGWARLKWLADLVMLFARLQPAQLAKLVEFAERTDTTAAVRASLLLFDALFCGSAPAVLMEWGRHQADSAAVQSRLMRYGAWLSAPGNTANPLNDRRDTLRANFQLHDRLVDRAMLSGPAALASGLRALGKMHAQPTSAIRSTETTRSPSSRRKTVTP